MSTRHVVSASEGWQVTAAGSRQVSAAAPTQRAAVASARTMVADEGGGQVIVHAHDGMVRETLQVGAGAARVPSETGRSIPRPAGGDAVELILDDHRLFEHLLRRLRDRTDDRAARLSELAAVLIAHGEAEEAEVYPFLKRKNLADQQQVEHGREEHDEGHVALAALFDVADVDSNSFDEGVEVLSEALSHHLDEEERELLNPARAEVPEARRAELGTSFAAARGAHLDADCGNPADVRRVAERAHRRNGV